MSATFSLPTLMIKFLSEVFLIPALSSIYSDHECDNNLLPSIVAPSSKVNILSLLSLPSKDIVAVPLFFSSVSLSVPNST